MIIKKKNVELKEKNMILDENKINVLIAHNGFGKTKLFNEIIKIKKCSSNLDFLYHYKKNNEIKYFSKKYYKYSFGLSSLFRPEIKNNKIHNLIKNDLKISNITLNSFNIDVDDILKLKNEIIKMFDKDIDDCIFNIKYFKEIKIIFSKYNKKYEIEKFIRNIDFTKEDFEDVWYWFASQSHIDEIKENEDTYEKIKDHFKIKIDPSGNISYELGENIIASSEEERISEIIFNYQDYWEIIYSELVKQKIDKNDLCKIMNHFLNINDHYKYPLSFFDLFFPNLSFILYKIYRIESQLYKIDEEDVKKIKHYLSNAPIKNISISSINGYLIFRNRNIGLSSGEEKWISNIISLVLSSKNNELLIFDDPLDSMDAFYSNWFLNMLIKSKRRNILILTHRSDILRYSLEKKANFKYYNFLFNEIDLNLSKLIATKSIKDIITKINYNDVIIFLIYFRFIFKNNKHTIYSLLSNEGIKNKQLNYIKPIIIELVGKGLWDEKYQNHSNEKISKIIEFDRIRNDEAKILKQFIFKNNDPYLTAMRHISESEVLDLYLFDSGKYIIK